MIIVDSCGWLEWFTDGEFADDYGRYLAKTEDILVPTIILYEVYKVLKQDFGEEKALLAIGFMKNCKIIPFDDSVAISAADIALKENLAMADAIIAATSRIHNCKIISSDADLRHLNNVIFIAKTGNT